MKRNAPILKKAKFIDDRGYFIMDLVEIYCQLMKLKLKLVFIFQF